MWVAWSNCVRTRHDEAVAREQLEDNVVLGTLMAGTGQKSTVWYPARFTPLPAPFVRRCS
ncbi:hypothetical protein LNP20_02435 [Klebsiella pneumoniae subsp. pneumoniae]|nr:hypothetical protein [Klebsiella pneumoniae subsp. pneumoniae]